MAPIYTTDQFPLLLSSPASASATPFAPKYTRFASTQSVISNSSSHFNSCSTSSSSAFRTRGRKRKGSGSSTSIACQAHNISHSNDVKPREELSYTNFFPDLNVDQLLKIILNPESNVEPNRDHVVLKTKSLLENIPKPSYRVVDVEPTTPLMKEVEFKRTEGIYLRYLEPTEAELSSRVEYDMDEQDLCWLNEINSERIKDSLTEVTPEAFEALVDRLEKEWFDLIKSIPKPEPEHHLSAEDAVCAICDDSECENSNAIVFCDGCNLAVHQDCYGIPYIPEGQWLCRKCMLSPEAPVHCVFCPNEGGAFKQTNRNSWGHLLCALWIPEVSVASPVYMEPIDSIEKIPKSRWKLLCYICKKKMGACIQCAHKNCFTAFHVTCARKSRLYMKMKSNTSNFEEVMLRAYCDKHTPKEHREKIDVNRASETFSNGPPGENSQSDWEEDKIVVMKRKRGRPSKKELSLRKALSPEKKHTGGKSLETIKHALRASKKPNSPPLYVPQYILTILNATAGKFQIQKKHTFILLLCKYWSLKREARRGAPLLKRLHLEPWTASASLTKETEAENSKKYEFLLYLRNDLERVRTLSELTRKREKEKLRHCQTIRNCWLRLFDPLCLILNNALDILRKSDTKRIFHDPVLVDEVPDYLTIVKNPMDFATMQIKLDSHEYNGVSDFEHDLRLIWQNCQLYNKPDTIYSRTAKRLERKGTETLGEIKKTWEGLSALDIQRSMWRFFDSIFMDEPYTSDAFIKSEMTSAVTTPKISQLNSPNPSSATDTSLLQHVHSNSSNTNIQGIKNEIFDSQKNEFDNSPSKGIETTDQENVSEVMSYEENGGSSVQNVPLDSDSEFIERNMKTQEVANELSPIETDEKILESPLLKIKDRIRSSPRLAKLSQSKNLKAEVQNLSSPNDSASKKQTISTPSDANSSDEIEVKESRAKGKRRSSATVIQTVDEHITLKRPRLNEFQEEEKKTTFAFKDLVWAKMPKFPWFPAEVCNPIDKEFKRIAEIRVKTTKKDYFIQFFDPVQTKVWLPPQNLIPLGTMDTDITMLKSPHRSSQKSKVRKAFKEAYFHIGRDPEEVLFRLAPSHRRKSR